MASLPSRDRPVDPPHARVLSLPERAQADLRLIRDTMARSGVFTHLSGRAVVGLGLLALLGGELARRTATPAGWWAVWLSVGTVGAIGGVFELDRKARTFGQSLRSGAGRRFAIGLVPPLAAAAVLTAALVLHGDGVVVSGLIPGIWLLLYGVALISGGATSVPVVRVLGGSFAVVGLMALVLPTWGAVLLSVGFGGLHLGFGIWIWRRYGG